MKAIIFTLITATVLFTSCRVSNVKQPEYRDIRDVKLVELGVLQSTAGVDLIYYNPNNFGVEVTSARGDVYLDNMFLGRFDLAEVVHVGKRSEFLIPALLKLDMIGLVKNQRDIIKKKEALVRIEGVAQIRKAGFTREIPIRHESIQNIDRLRSVVIR
ncbi:MAG: LEA type 2 family protein [Chitinophagaceae bacterium]|nr:LEA type 2 family protein [Chitinophagaceae bacterium]